MSDDFLKVLVSLSEKTKTNISKLEKMIIEVKPPVEEPEVEPEVLTKGKKE